MFKVAKCAHSADGVLTAAAPGSGNSGSERAELTYHLHVRFGHRMVFRPLGVVLAVFSCIIRPQNAVRLIALTQSCLTDPKIMDISCGK